MHEELLLVRKAFYSFTAFQMECQYVSQNLWSTKCDFWKGKQKKYTLCVWHRQSTWNRKGNWKRESKKTLEATKWKHVPKIPHHGPANVT